MIFLVQFGINKHSYIFSKTTNFVSLKKFTLYYYLFQIALEIILLPIQIDGSQFVEYSEAASM